MTDYQRQNDNNKNPTDPNQNNPHLPKKKDSDDNNHVEKPLDDQSIQLK